MEKIYEKINDIFEHGLINSMISIGLMIIFILILNHILNKWIKKKNPTNLKITMRFKKVFLLVLLLCVVFAQITPLKSLAATLLASGGILALVIGLASQEAASNMINGFMIYSYKPYKVNDFISIPNENVKGTVLDITLRHTLIETLEKTQMTIPNRIMNNAIIENISNVANKKANYLYIDISYESDIDKAIAVMQEVCSQHPSLIDIRTKKEKQTNKDLIPVLCTNLKESSIELRATVYSVNNDTGFQMLCDLRLSLTKAFKANNIEIPYPHMHIKADKKAS